MKRNWALGLAMAELSIGCAVPIREPDGPPTLPHSDRTARDENASTSAQPPDSVANKEQEATCRGKPSQALVKALSIQGASAKPCYDQLLKRNPEAKGRVLVAVRLGPDGRLLEEPVLVSDELNDQEMNECILEKFEAGAPATPPEGGCVNINIPLSLQPSRKRLISNFVHGLETASWGWSDESQTCTQHKIAFSEDRKVMTIDWQVPVEKRAGVAKSQSVYDVVSLEPSYARMKLRGEERRTANGELVVWDLIAQSAQEYCWHRTDWEAGACTAPIKGCKTDIHEERGSN